MVTKNLVVEAFGGGLAVRAQGALLVAAARERMSPGQDVLDLGGLPVVPARMDDVADWTTEPELALRPGTPAVGGRLAGVAAGGGSWGRRLFCSGGS